MTTVSTPHAMPTCPPASIRGTTTGTRAAAMAMSRVAGLMLKYSAPAQWEGRESEKANHLMTRTARRLDVAADALQFGLAYLDEYCDTLAGLRKRHEKLASDHRTRVSAATELRARLAEADGEATGSLEREIASHNEAVASLDSKCRDWMQDLSEAEDALVSQLQRADTVAEGRTIGDEAPSPTALRERALAAHAHGPAAVLRWWKSLDRDERELLKTAYPGLIGAMNGIPIIDRHETNLSNLQRMNAELRESARQGGLTADEERLRKNIRGVERGLRVDTGTDVSPFLMLFDPAAEGGDGHAAIAFGNPETAEHVTVNVPGVNNDMRGFDSVAATAAQIQIKGSSGGRSVASIAWLGYDTPTGSDLGNMTNETEARKGAKTLTDFVAGLQATDRGHPAHMTVIGHSYGSTTVAKAGSGGMRVDDIVLVGSPGAGSGNTHASDLHARHQVHVGSSDDDFVSRLGNRGSLGLGNDPAHMDFGARRFAVENSGDFSWSPVGLKEGLDNHTGYFKKDSSSLESIVKISVGESGSVAQVPSRENYTNYGWWTREILESTTNTPGMISKQIAGIFDGR